MSMLMCIVRVFFIVYLLDVHLNTSSSNDVIYCKQRLVTLICLVILNAYCLWNQFNHSTEIFSCDGLIM
jgi:hypothetical protein